MRRVLTRFGMIGLAAAALAFGLAMPAQAQYVVVPASPIVVQRPVVTYYPAPVVTYAAPRVSYYPAPVVTTYASPVYASPVVTTTYAAPVVTAPAPGVYTTYTYRNGLGVFRPRYVNETFYTPVR